MGEKVNIFYLDEDAKTSAMMHVDSHASKMIIEYAQLMSTAHRVLDGKQVKRLSNKNRLLTTYDHPDPELDHTLYKSCHVNHPSGIWVRQSKKNYRWLYEMWTELNTEFMYRYDKIVPHESYRKLKWALFSPPENMPEGEFTEPLQAMPDDVKNDSSITAYRDYYIKYKTHLHKWKNRSVPYWMEINNVT
tara:strand:- start:414 stop:983 length:570 start_codon:yes stop_codon:yes gene_type:complete